jgi:hypothetical protein
MSEVVMKLKFSGSYANLQQCVSRTGLVGKWRDLKYGQKQYRTARGGVLNWWETTGTITFQGLKARAKEKLEQAFIASAKRHLIGEYDGRVFCGRLRSLYPEKDGSVREVRTFMFRVWASMERTPPESPVEYSLKRNAG